MCKYCNTEKNLVHSGTDAFVLGCLDDLHKICYKCANKKNARRGGMKKYIISLRGHVVIHADSKKKAFEIADEKLKVLPEKFNISSFEEL